NPMYLWYLLSIPLLIYTHFYLFKHSKKTAMKFANFAALRRVTGKHLITKNIIVLIIRVVILISLIIAASGGELWYEGKVNQNDFVIAIDTSASMAAQDISPTRLEAAKEAAIEFVGSLGSRSNIGIISFSGTTFVETIPIDNMNSIKKTIENIDVAKTGGTDIAGAIITGTNLLLPYEKGKTIVLITDGSNTVGAFITDSVASSIAYAVSKHVIVHSIGVGSDAGPIGYLPEYYNISAVFHGDTLEEISNQTGGFYFQANNKGELIQAYRQISEASDIGFIPLNLSYGLILIALLLLFVEWGLLSTRFRKIP
ncbi:MAG: VWA domain-containing protein, partial [Nanoarchaeota archaeon]|nr:VWA domain-containing protein [Nanoarchaeota archaeon]MBU1597492.1 VWA domain-containing protein [Nanoarchaeota archaeon]